MLEEGFYDEDSDDSSLGDHVLGDGLMHHLALTLQFDGKMVGLKTLVAFESKTFLGRYTGDHLNYSEMLQRQQTEPMTQQYQVCIIPGVLYVCGKYNGNVLKLINNHCTKSDCKLYRYKEHNSKYAIGIWTSKKVKPGEHLYYTYAMEPVAQRKYPKLSCLCQGIDSNGVSICKTEL